MGKACLGALATLGVGALAVASYGALVERQRFRVRRDIAAVLDAGSEPIQILHLSDIHMAPWNKTAVSFIKSLVDLEPDLIIGTGDFLGHPEGLDALTEALAPLAGIPGVVTHGSNDKIAPRFKNPLGYLIRPSSAGTNPGAPMNFAGLSHLYTEILGWRDIDNAATRMTINGSTLDFIGVGDAHHDQDHLDAVPLVVENLKESDEDTRGESHPSITTIGVTHAPYRRVLDAFVTYGADIIFAGHTHGGQVCLPGQRALTTNSDLPLDQASGMSMWRHAKRASLLNVSAGLGTSIYAPIRLFCPPEAVLVTLVGTDIGYA
jgi:predicted MPP superfamily phosphohydrolase